MNILYSGLKALSSALASVAVTTLLSWGFVQSTSAAPFTPSVHTTAVAKFQNHRNHLGFGQALPAVLVD